MGEQHHEPFQLSFNRSLRGAFRGSRVTSDGGLMMVRELDERLGMGARIERYLTDTRRGRNTQLPLADLRRQSVYSRLAGYADVHDAERRSQDPTYRLIGSEQIWARGAALTSRLQSFETERLAAEEHCAGVAAINRELIARVEAVDAPQHRFRRPRNQACLRNLITKVTSAGVQGWLRAEESRLDDPAQATCAGRTRVETN